MVPIVSKWSYSPELKDALRRLRPWWRRWLVKLVLHNRMSNLSKWDERVCRYENSYDCGTSLINELTAGRYNRARRQREAAVKQVESITGPLMDWVTKQRY